MDSSLTRLISFGKSRRGGFLVLALAVAATVLWVQTAGHPSSAHGVPGSGILNHTTSTHPETGVALKASLSQPMVIQGGDGTVYLDLMVATPGKRGTRHLPTDILIVLDRSGSMADDDKWSYATEAVYSLLDHLRPSDKIALITFDTHARINSRLVPADHENTARLRRIVQSLRPGASTNLGDALLLAEQTVPNSQVSERRSRIILLSDGHANTGIVEPSELAAIGRRIADRGNVLSTIGMGLGFNENLMASLADHGMGSFNYLEHLEALASILETELSDSRRVLAQGSELRITLPSGMELQDVAGLPFSREGRTIVIRTGQLIQNSTKRFTTTLHVASHELAEYSISNIELDYKVDGQSFKQRLQSDDLTVACVAPEREKEVVASVDKDLFQDAWIRNNLGAVMRSVGNLVREGKREEAKELVNSYKNRLQKADAMMPGLEKQADEELQELESRVDNAFRGGAQGAKQNRAAKALLDASQKLQREVNRNGQ